MAIFEFQGPDGRTVEIDAPDQNAAIGAYHQFAGQPTQADQPQIAPETQQSQDLRSSLSALTQDHDTGTADRMAFDAMPTWQKPLQAADDIVRKGVNGLTMGFADKLAGYMSGTGTEAQRDLSQQASNRAGSAGTTAEIGGAIAAPVGLAGRGLTLAGRGGTAAMKGLPGLLARTGLMGAEGSGYGALTAAGNDQDIGQGAAIGLLGGMGGNVLGEGLAKGASKVASAFNKKPTVPTLGELRAAKDAAYKAADEGNGVFAAAPFSERIAAIRAKLADDAYLPGNQPGVKSALDELDRLDGQNITYKGLEAVRRKIRGGYNPLNKDNNRMLYNMIDDIDDFALKNGSDQYPDARRLFTQTSKIEAIQDALDKGANRAKLTGSGGNIDNTTRQRMDKVLEKRRGWTADEATAMREAAYGTKGRNLLRLAGRASPTTGALGLIGNVAMNGGALATGMGAVTLPLTLGSMVAKKLGERGTMNAARGAMRLIAAGGNKSALEAAPNFVQRLSKSKRDAISRMIMGDIVNQNITP